MADPIGENGRLAALDTLPGLDVGGQIHPMSVEIGTADKGGTPSAIRAACRAEVLRNLPAIVGILRDPFARDGDRIKAWAELAKIGIGAADQAAVHIHAEAGAMLGIVQLPAMAEPHEPLALTAESDARLT